MRTVERRLWAIDMRGPDGSYIGVFWFERGELPAHLDGCRIALFRTRRLAREKLPAVRQAFPRAQAVQVTMRLTKGWR